MEYTVQAQTIQGNGRAIAVTAYLPQTEEPLPAVLCSHGFNGRSEDLADCGHALAKNGIRAYCIDFCGGSILKKSSLPPEQMSLRTETEDLLALFDHVRAQPGTGKLFLYGESQGGLVSVLAAKKRQEQLGGVCLLYPALCIPDDWSRAFPEGTPVPPGQEFWGFPLGRGYVEEARKTDAWAALETLTLPLLLLHGDADAVVPVAYSRRAARSRAQATLVEYPGEGHGFSPQARQNAVCRLLAFVREANEK